MDDHLIQLEHLTAKFQSVLGNGANEQAWHPGEHWALAVERGLAERDALQGKFKLAAELIAEFAEHNSWRCAYYSECHCGLDDSTDRLQLPRVPYPPAT